MLTPPGYARDVRIVSRLFLDSNLTTCIQYVKKSDRPLIPIDVHSSWPSTVPSNTFTAQNDIEAANRDSFQRPRSSSSSAAKKESSRSPYGLALQRTENGLAGISYEDLLKRDGVAQNSEQEAGILDSMVPPKPAFMHSSQSESNPSGSNTSPVGASSTSNTPLSEQRQQTTSVLKKTKVPSNYNTVAPPAKDPKRVEREQRLESLNVTRRPPPISVLQPVHRYCTVDQIIKPYRTHHCRACGTVSNAPLLSNFILFLIWFISVSSSTIIIVHVCYA